MSRLRNAFTTNDVRGENGMPTNSTSGSYLLDLFAKKGAARTEPVLSLVDLFKKGFQEDNLLATKFMFYNRDIRGGQGERRSFRAFLKWMAVNHPDIVKKNIHLIPEYGRWDDLFELFDTSLEEYMMGFVWRNLQDNPEVSGLVAKWLPREGKKLHSFAMKFMSAWELSPKQYRELLAGNTHVVETLMCQKKWGDIKYEQVPSVSMKNYRKAFSKHDPDGFVAYLGDVKKGVKTIHAAALNPADLVEEAFKYIQFTDQMRGTGGTSMWKNKYRMLDVPQTDRDALNAQWKALPNWMVDGKSILPICDESRSMSMFGGKPSGLSAAVATTIYVAERNPSIFHNEYITFSKTPAFRTIESDDFIQNVYDVADTQWQENTDLAAVFTLVLQRAVGAKLPPEEMPGTLLIISDMQFDTADSGWNQSALQMIDKKYESAGYSRPQIVFWNVRDSIGVAAKSDSKGVALVSGYSPSIMKQLCGTIETPMDIMLKTLNSERYSAVTL